MFLLLCDLCKFCRYEDKCRGTMCLSLRAVRRGNLKEWCGAFDRGKRLLRRCTPRNDRGASYAMTEFAIRKTVQLSDGLVIV